MKRPFRFIDSKITTRNEFQLTEGMQPTCALFYLKEGAFTLTLNGQETNINAGDLIIFPDDIPFRRHVTTPIVFAYIKFTIEQNCPYLPPIPYGKIALGAHRERILANLDMLESLRENIDQRSALLREHLLEDILLLLDTAAPNAADTNKEQIFTDALVLHAKTYIDNHLEKPISLSDICKAVGTNASTINFRFRRTMNMGAGAYLITARMRLAQTLLLTTTYRVGEIAARCGYDNIYYFSTAFKKWAGVSPTALRNRVYGKK